MIAPAFISYSRRDYYFAESLAFHLERRGMRVWLDAKDLKPGESWQQQLEGAIDEAPCFIVVISADSIKRPYVRMEWERARQKGKRIIAVVFRKAQLPEELVGCETVDFRGGFERPLRELLERIASTPQQAKRKIAWLPWPPWIGVVSLTLLVPLVSYLLLADWTENKDSKIDHAIFWVLLPPFLFAFAWFLCFSFWRRKMGMTHLLVAFVFFAIVTLYPLAVYRLEGPSGLGKAMLTAVTQHSIQMEFAGAIMLAGLGIVLIVRPEDLLRWTPTGKAWEWYREGRLAKFAGADQSSVLRQVKQYTLLHDAADGPAAKRMRKEMSALGACETLELCSNNTKILLLTSRTRTQWLTDQMPKLTSNVLTIVGSRIGLPEQLDELWKREWIDFRHWDIQRLDRKKGLLHVPEAVTGTRYPAVVRLFHQMLCSLAALAFCLLYLADPQFANGSSDQDSNPLMIIFFVVSVWCGVLAQRLLNRTISENGFGKAWWIGLAATAGLAIWAFAQSPSDQVTWWRAILIAGFLMAFPYLLLARKDRLTFWFPTPAFSNAGKMARLAAGRQWQTLVWVCVHVMVWGMVTGVLFQ